MHAMSLVELRNATLAPSRWRSLILRRGQIAPCTLPSSSTSPILLKRMYTSSMPGSTAPYFLIAHPIPGGRYMVMIVNKQILRLVDLGVPGRPLRNPPNIVAEVDLWKREDGLPRTILSHVCITEGDRLRVVASQANRPEVYVTADSCRLNLLTILWKWDQSL